MTVAEIRQQLKGLPDDMVVMLYDLEVSDRYSIDCVDVIWEMDSVFAVDINYNSAEYEEEDDAKAKN